MTITTGKLYSKSLALEVAPMIGYRFKREKVSLLNSQSDRNCRWNNVIIEKGRGECAPGTTSFASASLSYWMKPKPFMSLTSTMFPLPCSLKKSSTSCFLAVIFHVSEERWSRGFRPNKVRAKDIIMSGGRSKRRQRCHWVKRNEQSEGDKRARVAYHLCEDCPSRGEFPNIQPWWLQQTGFDIWELMFIGDVNGWLWSGGMCDAWVSVCFLGEGRERQWWWMWWDRRRPQQPEK